MRTANRTIALAVATVLGAALAHSGWGFEAAAQTAKKEELSESYRGSQKNNVAFQKVPPIKVFDNLYYVGPGFVSVWLISTPQGAILIDTAEEPYVDHVIDSIKKSGFALSDIKYIVLSHGHLDHFGGAARIQELSGARVAALEEDWALMERAAKAPGRNNSAPPPIPKRDMVVKEGDTLTLGGTTLKFYKHPGHTAGSLSAEFTVFDRNVPAGTLRAQRSSSRVPSASPRFPACRSMCRCTAGSPRTPIPMAASSSAHKSWPSGRPASPIPSSMKPPGPSG